MIEEEPD